MRIHLTTAYEEHAPALALLRQLSAVDRRRVPSGAKTDLIDAYLLAKTGRADLADLRRLQPDSPLIQELKTLTRDQEQLIQMQGTRAVKILSVPKLAKFAGVHHELEEPRVISEISSEIA